MKEYRKYELETYLQPIWNKGVLYNETAMFVGAEDEAPLLYNAKEIISVRNYGLDIEYTEGKDYIVENNKIKRTKDSAIPYMEINEYYRETPDIYRIEVDKMKATILFNEQRFMKYGEQDTFTKYQIAVTYIHNETMTSPIRKRDKLHRFYQRLKNGEPQKILFYGDSITVGCNSSNTEAGGYISPFVPSFPEMVVEYLRKNYSSSLEYFNTAVGGWGTRSGLENFDERVLQYCPDLLILGFGMNDGNTPTEEYRLMITEMMERLRSTLPNTDVVLVGTTVPNIETDWYKNQELFVEELNKIEDLYSYTAVADVTTIHKELFKRGKRFRDVTGNNINHPNDFVARIYAQVILQTMLGEDFD